jgi:calcium permeable stress-gated cation channel
MLGFATIGMLLFYLAWRYNVFFVTDTTIDTRGLIYPRALKQLMTGIYLAEICMIGLFGASVAPGPLVLMVAFLVFTVLFHISLNSAIDPLLYNLPQTLLAEEEHRALDIEAATRNGTNGSNGADDKKAALTQSDAPGAPKKANVLTRFLKPWTYADYDTQRALVPHDFVDFQNLYPGDTEQMAYYPPSATSSAPLLWIPRDRAGVSRQEIAHTSKVIPITDEGAELNEKGKISWDSEGTRPPVWEEKIIY